MKLAFDARAVNQFIAKNKSQIPNLDNLVYLIAEKLVQKEREGLLFVSRYDLRLRTKTIISVNQETLLFSDCRGQINGNAPVYSGILWPNTNAHEVSKTLGSHNGKKSSEFVYLDDILIVTEGPKHNYLNMVREIMKVHK